MRLIRNIGCGSGVRPLSWWSWSVILMLALGGGASPVWAQSSESVSGETSSAQAVTSNERESSNLRPAPDPDLIEAGTPAGEPPVLERGGIEEITVTAERRETNLQDTPTAITALSGAQLFDRGIYDIEALATQVPNFQYGETFGLARISIRGITNTAFTFSSTAFHIDGVYQNNPTAASALTFYDVAQVEVLRGPQGTLWGRNSTAGAMNVSSRRPIHEFEVFGDVLYGAYDQVFLQGVVNVPILQDRVAARTAVYMDKRDGYLDNLFIPGDSQDADDADNWGIRPQVLFDVSDDLSVVVRGLYNHQGGVGWGSKIVGAYPQEYVLPDVGIARPYAYPGPPGFLPSAGWQNVESRPGYGPVRPNPTDDRERRTDAYLFQDVATWSVNGTINWVLPTLPGVGDTVFELVASYRREDRTQSFDVDLTEQTMMTSNVTASSTDRVVDAHWRSNNDSQFEWLLGFFAMDTDGSLYLALPGPQGASTIFNVMLDPPFPDSLGFDLPLSNSNIYGSNENLALAPYGHAKMKFLDDTLEVGLGLRFNYDDMTGVRGSTQVNLDASCVVPNSDKRDSDDWTAVTGDLKVQYSPAEEKMIYGSISRGYKPGYINGDQTETTVGCTTPNSPLPNAASESIWAYEIGSKNRFFDNRVQANFTLFFYDFDNYQVADQAGNTTYVQNAQDSRIWGGEFEGIWMPIENLSLSLTYGYLNAKYTRYVGYDFETAQNGVDFSGNWMIRAPENSATLAAEYLWNLGRFGNIIPRIQYYVSDKIYFAASNSEESTEPAYGDLEIRTRWESQEADFFIEGFVQNLINNNVRSTRSVGQALFGAPILASFEPPRTWGIRVGASY